MAAGCYMPSPDELRAVRMHLAEHHAAFHRLARAPKLRSLLGDVQGARLTRPPKGFPDLDILRHKQFYWSLHLDSAIAATPQFFRELLSRFAPLSPSWSS